MTILQIPAASVMAWLLAIAFAGAGLFNAVGGAAVQAQFLRWGYPAGWNVVASVFDGLGAALIFLPETRNTAACEGCQPPLAQKPPGHVGGAAGPRQKASRRSEELVPSQRIGQSGR